MSVSNNIPLLSLRVDTKLNGKEEKLDMAIAMLAIRLIAQAEGMPDSTTMSEFASKVNVDKYLKSGN